MRHVKDGLYSIVVLVFIIAAMTLVSGCAQIGEAVEQAAVLNDEALNKAEFTICNAASVGSVKRRYNTPELIETWQRLCNDSSAFTP